MTKDHLYPEEVRAQAIDRRWRQFARQRNVVMVLEISDILKTEDNRIQVQTLTGHSVWLPRKSVGFAPGSVVLPSWLFAKVGQYFQPTA